MNRKRTAGKIAGGLVVVAALVGGFVAWSFIHKGIDSVAEAVGVEQVECELLFDITCGPRKSWAWAKGLWRWAAHTREGHPGNGDGHEVVRMPDGWVLEGPLVDGKPEGRWTARGADGTVAEGSLVDGRKEGHWVERMPDGAVTEGSFVAGKREGHWVTRIPDGKVAEGLYGRWQAG